MGGGGLFILGAFFIVVVMFFKGGVYGAAERVYRWLKGKINLFYMKDKLPQGENYQDKI